MKNAITLNHNSVFFYLLATFILTLPYNISTWWVGTFSIALALITLNNPSRKTPLQSIFHEKILQALVAFIFFTYISVLWSQSPEIFNGDLNTNVDRFKYFFLILPAIYFSNLTKQDIKKLFFIIALAPSISILIYYSNYFGISNIFPVQDHNNELILRHYLIQNFFILFTALYLYINIFTVIKNNNYIKLLIYVPLLLLVCLSLILDDRTDSRLIDLVLILMLIFVPFYYLRLKSLITFTVILLAASLIMLSSLPPFQKGIDNFNHAIHTDTYTGSWGHRLGYTIVGLKILKENPLIGRGINDITRPIKEAYKAEPKYFIGENLRHFHNEHINILVAAGIVGYSLLLYFFFLLFKLNINNKKIHVFKNTTIVILLLTMIGEHYLTLKSTINFFFIFIALVVAYKNIEERNTE